MAEHILSHPGSKMADVIHVSPTEARTTYHNLTRLLREGLVLSTSPTRHVGLHPAPDLAQLLAYMRGEAASPGGPPDSIPEAAPRAPSTTEEDSP